MRIVRGMVGAVGVLLLVGCDAAGGGSGAAAEAEALTLAGDSASNPTTAFDPRSGRTYLAWVGVEAGVNAVFVAAMDGEGGGGVAPVRANDIPGDAAPHAQAPAQVAVGPEGNVYVLWQNNTPVEGRRFPASDLRLAASTDGGRSFRPAVTVNDDAGGPPTSHTFHDLAVAEDGTVLVSWIDSRSRDAAAHQRMPAAAGAGADAHAHHGMGGMEAGTPADAHHEHGVAVPEGPEIRVARSLDGGATFSASVVVDSAACPCCRTSLTLGPDGAVYLAWRKIFPGDVRDIVVARAEPGSIVFGEPVRVHRDEWVFPGCPHAGPSLAVDAAGTLLVGWYTGKAERQGLWYAASSDGGRTFGTPAAVLTADFVPPSQLRLAVQGSRVWAAWDDRTGETPRVRLASGVVGGPLTAIDDGNGVSGGDPEVAATAEGAVVAWLDGAAVKVRRMNGEW